MSQLLSKEETTKLRLRLMHQDVRQGDVAQELGLDPGYVSRILNGRKPAPSGFEERFHQAVDMVLRRRAEKALASVGSSAQTQS